MERSPSAHSSIHRRCQRDRGCAQDRRVDRPRSATLERGARLEGKVGGGCFVDQLAWRSADRLFRVGPTQDSDVTTTVSRLLARCASNLPITDASNTKPEYLVSTTLTEPRCANTTVLSSPWSSVGARACSSTPART